MAYNTNTKLLLHMDGADASTTFTDNEQTAKTVTANGNAQIDTAQSKFGGASGLFDGTGDYLSLADTADWDFDANFTIDCWYKANARVNYAGIIATLNYGGGNIDGWRLSTDFIDASNQPASFIIYVNNAATTSIIGTSDINDGTWHHLAVTRSGTDVKLFVDGTQQGSTATVAGTVTAGGGGLFVGRNYDDLSQDYINGWVDEVQILKGEALWTTNFTSPSAAYDNYTVSPSASLSPSASRSPSASASASLSPSASRSPSASASPSISASLSPSASASPSISVSSSISASISPSASRSPSASASTSPSFGYTGYTRGDYAALPTNDADLEVVYSDAEVTTVSGDDNTRVGQDGAIQYILHQFKNFVGSKNYCQIDTVLQSELPAKYSPVMFQIFNKTEQVWETLDMDNRTKENKDIHFFRILTDLVHYKSEDGTISCRVYQLGI